MIAQPDKRSFTVSVCVRTFGTLTEENRQIWKGLDQANDWIFAGQENVYPFKEGDVNYTKQMKDLPE